MKRLLLLRHAKAAQDTGEGDHDRPLTDRGRKDAARVGHAMDVRGYGPDSVLCSKARRTMETWQRLSPELVRAPAPEFCKELYLASPKTIVGRIQHTPSHVTSLLLLGHNPGIEECALRLARTPVSKAEARHLQEMKEKFPTCALAVLDFDVESWSDATGGGILLEFIRPRDLRD
jgi:phosphohistidine phosphatase